jgi:methylphosphotriester-DNA--protein-cysteine methyltransferase
MLFRSYIPCMPLREFIEDFWLYEHYAGEHSFERILPSGTFEMVFNFREDQFRIYDPADLGCYRTYAGALISGPYAGPFVSDVEEETSIMGVHFRPGGAFAILGLPAGVLTNAHVDLRTIWGASATLLREQLCASRQPLRRFRILERALLDRLVRPSTGHHAVRTALNLLAQSHGQIRTRDLARRVDLSQRRFIEVFAAEVGMTPKLFGRIQRFHHVIAMTRNLAKPDWAQIALDAGYFDQSHLIGEFVEFSGATPSEYLGHHNRLAASGAHVKRLHLPCDA